MTPHTFAQLVQEVNNLRAGILWLLLATCIAITGLATGKQDKKP
jgi:hypothetical protein